MSNYVMCLPWRKTYVGRRMVNKQNDFSQLKNIKMQNLKELPISDLKALFDYFRLIIEDAVSDNGLVIDRDTIVKTEPKLTAVNEELKRRIKVLNF